MGGLISALRTLTILPVPGRDARQLSDSLSYFPLVGALLGLMVSGAGLGLLAVAPGWYAGAAALVLVLEMVLTGALHTDGLGDTADSLGAGRDRQRALAIMKDSCQGSYGVVAIVLVLLLKWVVYTRLLALPGGWILIIAAFAASRQATAHLAASQPYARPEGGTGAAVAGVGLWPGVAVGWLLALALCVPAGWLGAAGLALSAAVALIFGRWCRARYGGVTGDLLGAHTEGSVVAVLFLMALLN
ncbi:MAG: adenosylcobinamide-GDP ribazoletransferase [Eubacteriales bacterium]|nr:adenosylcobinamide-GDP ribazoletransferase [Bacillota bacterium]MBV1728422.1 adenosylcobinamide-GDP ribazoletransferase [Desulforudis sp.]MDP3050680.1 adenosylcobinamide-GDP ribazoletransferase [Eubacteriales bacterium]MBU4532229.1 adenosylcobinamide-GDP ribazoletransferase [Bacillota bacterium]MBU4555011.1 adenosylcobinamide-GDP ribazoletransferase [Bacillota bacterium]